MGRFRDFSGEDTVEAGIDMSPLIDCVFIMLIFFIVTTVFVKEPTVDVDRVNLMTAEQLERNSIFIAVTPDGEVVYADRDIGVTGVQPLVKRMTQKRDIPVIIQADANATSGTFIRVVEEAQLAGATQVNIASRPIQR